MVHNVRMKINATSRLLRWAKQHAKARKALDRWVAVVEESDWRSSADVAATFGRSADRISHRGVVEWVFNIGGNNYRLIAHVDFDLQEVTPRLFLTHAEYSKNRWKDQL